MPNAAADTALTYTGVREQTGKNDGFEIEKFQARGGGRRGWAWCMYFVYYSFDQAAKSLNKKNPLLRTGSCARQLKAANGVKSTLMVIPVSNNIFRVKFRRGDILIFKKGRLSKSDIARLWAGHTAIVLSQIDDKSVLTIEGNTNKKGSREGDGVYRKVRKINTIKALIRII